MRKVFWIIIIVLIAIWADLNFNWTGYGYVNLPLTQEQAFSRHKTIWNWLELLIIPAALAVAAVYLNQAERKSEREVAAKQAEDTALETYLKEMSELLLMQHLRESPDSDEKRTLARAWTLTIARRLGEENKGTLLRFLSEAKLIHKDNPIISISGIDLSGASLRGADLSHADLRHVNLREANLMDAVLHNADLHRASLYEAYLPDADLRGANLSDTIMTAAILVNANLCGTNLCNVELVYANLSNANLTDAVYDQRTQRTTDIDLAKCGATLKKDDS